MSNPNQQSTTNFEELRGFVSPSTEFHLGEVAVATLKAPVKGVFRLLKLLPTAVYGPAQLHGAEVNAHVMSNHFKHHPTDEMAA